MLYFFVRPFARIAIKIYFRKIYLSRADKIPHGKPIIFACNHPTAFLEPCILACILPLPLHFMVRGSLFKNNFANQFLFALNLIPIFRGTDKFKNRRTNTSILEKCFNILKENKAILIMAEGHTFVQKRLRPLKKGTARLAFGALQNTPDLDIQVIPVGATFSKSEQFRSEVYFEIGDPIPIQQYKSAFEQDAIQTAKNFTSDLSIQMGKHLVDVKSPKNDLLAEQCLEMYRNEHPLSPWPILCRKGSRLHDQINIGEQINALSENSTVGLKEKVNDYFQKLEQSKLSDKAVVDSQKFSWLKLLMLMPGFPFFIIGYWLNIVPFALSYFITKKKVHIDTYIGPVKLALGLAFYFVYYIICFAVITYSDLPWYMFFIIPLLGYFALIWGESYKRWQGARKAKKMSEFVDERRSLKKKLSNVLTSQQGTFV